MIKQLKKWWGPQEVLCIGAEVDLRVGGNYRIANQFPDGKVLWITGEFEAIERPHKLAYTWRHAQGWLGCLEGLAKYLQRGKI